MPITWARKKNEMVVAEKVYKHSMLVFVVSYLLENVLGFFDAGEVNIGLYGIGLIEGTSTEVHLGYLDTTSWLSWRHP